MESEWPNAFLGISVQIKSSHEYLHPENQSYISMLTDIKDYRILNLQEQEQFGALIQK